METKIDNIINVPSIEPKLKHPTIFKRFDELKDGESIIIHNDHDPKPVYYQLLGERGNVFVWEYLEQGPEWWKVKIQKRSLAENEETLGELAAKDLRKVEIFKKYGLDFSCDSKKTVKEACSEKELDVTLIEQELQQADKNPIKLTMPYDEWNLDFFVDYIVNTHHRFIRKNLPAILTYAQSVSDVHSNKNPELIEINTITKLINDTLIANIEEQETVLFPKIKALVIRNIHSSKTESLQNSIDASKNKDLLVAESFEKIKKLSNNYTLPTDACESYIALYRLLHEMEVDLSLHNYLEHNILFSKAIDLDNL